MNAVTKFIIAIMVLSLSFCRSSEGIVLDSSGENLEERISTMNKIIGPISSVPSKILDTHYIEAKIGNGRIGPSDYYFYASIKVSKGEVKKWYQKLKGPYNGVTQFSSPEISKNWWLTKKKFTNLKLYETKTYFGRYNGWLAVDDENDQIFVHTYTQ